MASLGIRGITKRFGATEVLKGIDLDLDDGEFLVLVGPSGCGKSTLLNIIAGLETPSEGEVVIGGAVVNDVAPRDRDIAMVFQSYALYPTMTVRENITFGLRMRGVAKPERERAVAKVATMLQIGPLLDRKPGQLSGGQRQRVAMGRALVRDPQIFLFDEPLSNLDAKLRVEMRHEIKTLHRAVARTMVYVTHDQVEAMTLASRIAVMHQGVIQHYGTPAEIYERPANLFVAGFMGAQSMNFAKGLLVGDSQGGGMAVRLDEAKGPLDLPLARPGNGWRSHLGRPVILGLRPEYIGAADPAGLPPGLVAVERRVDMIEPTGADTMVFFQLGGTPASARVAPRAIPGVGPGALSTLAFDMTAASLFDPDTERRL